MKRNTYIHIFFSAIILTLIVSFSACRKEQELISKETSGAKFIFNVSNHIGSANKNKLASSMPLTSISNPLDVNSKSFLSMKNNVNLIADEKESSSRNDILKTKSKIDKKIASNSPVHLYTHYKLLIYNITKDTLEKIIDAEADRNLVIDVIQGDEYKWYAYSYNTQGLIDTITMKNDIPTSRTLLDKEFLWASSVSSITATNQPISLEIVFDHKVAEVILEIDIKDLHGTIADLNIEFEDPNYFNTASINLLTGEPSDIQNHSVETLTLEDFEYDISSDSTILRATFYTAVPLNKIENLKVNIKKITVLHDNNKINYLHKLADDAREVQFAFSSPHVSKSHVASMQFKYAIPTKRILHVIGYEVNDDDEHWGFAAQPRSRDLTDWTYVANNEFAPLNMIKQPLNFGNLTNSIVHTGGFTHVRCVHNELATKLTVAGEIPDIVIISVYYFLRPEDIVALKTYLDNGGVVIMMTDSATPLNASSRPNEVHAVEAFFQSFFNNTAIELDYGTNSTRYYGPLMFQLDHEHSIRDRIINGPFGDLEGKYWGNDSYAVVQAINLPIGTGDNQVTVYSNPRSANSALPALGVSMFKHNSKNFFWIGDGSFLAHPNRWASGWSGGWNAEPFATVSASQSNPNPGPNYVHYPVSKRYGVDYGGVGYNFGAEVYNAPLFANLMAWALYQAEFFGRSSKISTNIKDWNVKEDSFNINY